MWMCMETRGTSGRPKNPENTEASHCRASVLASAPLRCPLWRPFPWKQQTPMAAISVKEAVV